MAPTLPPNLAEEYKKQTIIQPLQIPRSLEFKIILITVVILVVFLILATGVAVVRLNIRQRQEAELRAEIEAQVKANAQSKGPLRQLLLPTFNASSPGQDDGQKPLLLPLMVSATPRIKASVFTKFLGRTCSRNEQTRSVLANAAFRSQAMDGMDLEAAMKADFAAQLALANVPVLKSVSDWPVYIPRKADAVVEFPQSSSPTTSEGTASSRASVRAVWAKEDHLEDDSCPDISNILDEFASASVGLSIDVDNNDALSVTQNAGSSLHAGSNLGASSVAPLAAAPSAPTPSRPLIHINAVAHCLASCGQPRVTNMYTPVFPVPPGMDYLQVPPPNWTAPRDHELESADAPFPSISNVSGQAFVLGAPPFGRGRGRGRGLGIEAAAMICSTSAPTGLGANSLQVVPDCMESRYPKMTSPKTLRFESLPLPPSAVIRPRPLGIVYGRSGSKSL